MITTIILAIVFSQQPAETVAITLAPNSPAEIILKSDAEAQFKKLCVDGSDEVRLHALAVALNPMPDWPQYVMNKEASVCNRNPKPVVPIPIEKQSGSAFVRKGQ